MNIAFCDDDPEIREHIRDTVCRLFSEKNIPVNARDYPCGKDLLADMGQFMPDLLFLDIDLPDTDGVRFGEQLRMAGSRTEIVFVSNMEQRVFDVFGIRPLSFIRKSRFDEEIQNIVTLFIDSDRKKNAQILLHDEDGQTLTLLRDTIIYVESSGKIQKFFCVGDTEPVAARAVLRELDQQLSPAGFIRIHKGFLVNYRFIRKISSRSVFLDNGKDLPIGRDRLQEVRERYMTLMKWRGFGNAN